MACFVRGLGMQYARFFTIGRIQAVPNDQRRFYHAAHHSQIKFFHHAFRFHAAEPLYGFGEKSRRHQARSSAIQAAEKCGRVRMRERAAHCGPMFAQERFQAGRGASRQAGRVHSGGFEKSGVFRVCRHKTYTLHQGGGGPVFPEDRNVRAGRQFIMGRTVFSVHQNGAGNDEPLCPARAAGKRTGEERVQTGSGVIFGNGK